MGAAEAEETLRFSAQSLLFANLVADARQSAQPALRLKALRELELLLTAPADAVTAVTNAPMLALLGENLPGVDTEVELLTAQCLSKVFAQRWTRKRALEAGLLTAVLGCAQATEPLVRLSGYRAALSCLADSADAQLFVTAKAMGVLVSQLAREQSAAEEENALVLCELLSGLALLPSAGELLAATGAVGAAEGLLSMGSKLTRAGLELLGLLALNEAGRAAAVAAGLPQRIDSKRDCFQSDPAQAAALLFLLAALAKDVPTKKALAGSGCVNFTLETVRLHSNDEGVTLHALLALTELAEEAGARMVLLPRLEELRGLDTGTNSLVNAQLRELLTVVQWRP